MDDIIDAAMDAAEAKMGEAPEAPAASDTGPVTTPAPKAETPRDGSGKFTKAQSDPRDPVTPPVDEPEAEEEDLSDQPTIETPSETPVAVEDPLAAGASIAAPQFWSAEHRMQFAKAPPEVQKTILHYEQQRNAYVSRLRSESEPALATVKRINELFEPHRAQLTLHGVRTAPEAVERLLAWDEVFRTDPRAAINDLMRKNGLSPQDLLGDDSYETQTDPRIDELSKVNTELSEKVTQITTSLEEQKSTALKAEIEAFKDGKDRLGNQRRAFAEMYAPQIAYAAQSIQAINPSMPLRDVLANAYEGIKDQVYATLGVKPQVALGAAPARTDEQIVADAKRAKAASSSVVGGPKHSVSTVRPPLKGKNWNEKLEAAIDNAEERHSAR